MYIQSITQHFKIRQWRMGMSVMGKFLVLKEQSARGKLRSAVVVDLANKNYKANKLCVTGNLPELYQGMFIELTLDRAENKKTSFVTNYKVDFDEEKLSHFTESINAMKKKGEWSRGDLIDLFNWMIPNFNHKETGKFLDGRM